ncbi:hypothetical protein [Thalassotalea piscium]|uniref:Uncharacterized protein n=1 Tax=Thalassotalea piscium TaxID=1230533 RepID=A0A7X0NGJ1_9GAMM|nr:hypothetical protein [Thalassotalea piscium]MBB6543033.1 hypothetical protein [Thalassotalea piscium]
MKKKFYSTIAAQFTEPSEYFERQKLIPLPPEPTSTMCQYENMLSISNKAIKSDTTSMAMNGWLNTKGEIYPCKWREHSKVTRLLGYDTEAAMEKDGWIKLSQMKWLICGRYSKIELNKAQDNAIRQWHSNNKLDVSYYEFTKSKL